MKIKSKKIPYDEFEKIPVGKHFNPKKPNIFFRTLLKTVGASDLKNTRFEYRKIGMEKLCKNEPCLILMNHSSFIDLKIVTNVFYPRPINIVCTNDGFVGKKWLMRNLGCIPTKKFITDLKLVKDMMYALNTLKSSVLMYPEASYSFDGTATPLPQSLGKCLKMLAVPVIMVRTYGAFLRDPLYNNLQLRNVKVTADIEYLFSKDDVKNMSADEINEKLKEKFTFDNFRLQQQTQTAVNESFRADGLERVLYRCPHCQTESKMKGSGTEIKCENCGKTYTLSEIGFLQSEDAKFDHIPDWYAWERKCVRDEIENGSYLMDIPVKISALKNTDCLYEIGEGRLVHNEKGFTLTGCDGKLNVFLATSATYSLYADYFWYEIGDVICIPNGNIQYYCFPQNDGIVAKARLAAEELYKISKTEKAPLCQ